MRGRHRLAPGWGFDEAGRLLALLPAPALIKPDQQSCDGVIGSGGPVTGVTRNFRVTEGKINPDMTNGSLTKGVPGMGAGVQ